MGFASECALTCVIEEVGGSGVSGTACVQEKEGGGIVFSGDAACGVKGHTVIVHKGCPAEEPNCNTGGDRIGCCVLA